MDSCYANDNYLESSLYNSNEDDSTNIPCNKKGYPEHERGNPVIRCSEEEIQENTCSGV